MAKDLRKDLVVKGNRLVEASYKLTLIEQRVLLMAITASRREQKSLDNFVSIRASDYCNVYNLTIDKAYEQLKEAAATLFHREFTFHTTCEDTGKPEAGTYRWLSAVKYVDGNGLIKLQFTPVVVQYITWLEREFTKYHLEQIAGMSSCYAIRLYELLVQWGSVGKREVEIGWLKGVLVLDKAYDRIDNLKKYVIDIAVKQINEHSDINVEYTQRKTGRNVTHLIFNFVPKENLTPEMKKSIAEVANAKIKRPRKSPDVAKPVTQESSVTTEPEKKSETKPEIHHAFQFAKVAIPAKLQQKYLSMRSAEEIILCLKRANEYGEEQELIGKKPAYGALYRTAIEEGWHVEQARKEAEQACKEAEQARRKNEAEEKQRIVAEEQAKSAQEAENKKLERDALMDSFNKLPADEQTRLINEFLNKHSILRTFYKKHGLNSPIVFFSFVDFLRTTNVFPTLMPCINGQRANYSIPPAN